MCTLDATAHGYVWDLLKASNQHVSKVKPFVYSMVPMNVNFERRDFYKLVKTNSTKLWTQKKRKQRFPTKLFAFSNLDYKKTDRWKVLSTRIMNLLKSSRNFAKWNGGKILKNVGLKKLLRNVQYHHLKIFFTVTRKTLVTTAITNWLDLSES